jgi:hypothetical protein
VASILRVSAAFWLAAITAVPVGIAMGMSRVARGIFDPPIEFYRPLPPLAYLPLIIIWFGIDELPKVLLIYLSCFAPLALAARSGMKSASQEQINAAYSMGATYTPGDPPRDPAVGAARDPGRHAHRHRFRLDHAGGRRDGGGQRRPRARWCSTPATSCAPTS